MILRWAILLSWVALVVTVSVLPRVPLPAPDIPESDKVAHFLIYGIMAALVHYADRRASLLRAILVTAACGALGGALEIAQGFIPGRSASLADALSNLLGAAAVSAAWFGWVRRRPPIVVVTKDPTAENAENVENVTNRANDMKA